MKFKLSQKIIHEISRAWRSGINPSLYHCFCGDLEKEKEIDILDLEELVETMVHVRPYFDIIVRRRDNKRCRGCGIVMKGELEIDIKDREK